MRLLPGVLLVLASCAHVTATARPALRTFTLESVVLGETRTINVQLPPEYDGARRFDVVFMPDGALDEDFPHVAQTLETLRAAGTVPPVVLVGIANTARRRDLTGPTEVAEDRTIAPVVGGSAAFLRFVRDELIPFVETNYRVTPHRALLGESLAGLWVVETFFLAPGLFERSAALSPSLWWNDRALVRQAAERLDGWAGPPVSLYLTAADEEGIADAVEALAKVLQQHAPASLRWVHVPRPSEHHDTIFRASEADALTWLLQVR